MTSMGVIHLLSVLYLSAVICLSVSINENDRPGRVLRETLRRWGKFLGVALAVAAVVALIS